MLHVWLVEQQGKLRYWQAAAKQWQWVDDWQALRVLSDDRSVCLYIPTQTVLSLTSELSQAQLKQLGHTGQQYLFEEISLTSVEQLRVRTIPTPNQQYLYALAKTDIEQWQQSASLAQFEIQAILPDFVLLPTPTHIGSQVMIYHDSHTALMRLSEAQGMAVAYLPLLSPQLAQMNQLENISLIPDIDMVAEHDARYPLTVDMLSGMADNEQSFLLQTLQQSDALLNILSRPLEPVSNPERHALNMVEKQNNQYLSAYLKVVILVAAVALGVQMSADALQWYRYQQAEQSTASAINEQFSYWFAGESLNPQVTVMTQVTPKLLASQMVDTSQIELLNRVAPLIKQSALVAQSLSWDDNAIRLSLFAEQRAALDTLVSALASQGIEASLGRVAAGTNTSAGETNTGVVGELTLPLNTTSSNVDNTNNPTDTANTSETSTDTL